MALDPVARYGTGEYFGLKDLGRGWVPCTPAEIAALRGERPRGSDLLAATTPTIAGYDVSATLGIVNGTGHVDSTNVSQRKAREGAMRSLAWQLCIDSMLEEAADLGADAIVSIQVNAVSGNIGGATIGTAAGRGDVVTVFGVGTAVKLTKKDEQ